MIAQLLKLIPVRLQAFLHATYHKLPSNAKQRIRRNLHANQALMRLRRILANIRKGEFAASIFDKQAILECIGSRPSLAIMCDEPYPFDRTNEMRIAEIASLVNSYGVQLVTLVPRATDTIKYDERYGIITELWDAYFELSTKMQIPLIVLKNSPYANICRQLAPHSLQLNNDNPLSSLRPVLESVKREHSRRQVSAVVTNRKMHKRVDLLTQNFFDSSGKSLVLGGAERYLFDLADLIRETGNEPTIIQHANSEFQSEIDGIRVLGFPLIRGADVSNFGRAYKRLNRSVSHLICSPMDIAQSISGLHAIGINHGIHWDHGMDDPSGTANSWAQNMTSLAGSHVSAVVCVDTNYINWARCNAPNIVSKLKYIPNYYDDCMFMPTDASLERESRAIRICFPRRLCRARGVYIAINAARNILPQYSNVEFDFVGQVDELDVQHEIEMLVRDFPGRVSHRMLAMKDMPLAYAANDIILIPTLKSEGTSLSCIEALACGKCVIATNVGGLANIIFDRFNGRLVAPETRHITSAIKEVVESSTLRHQYAANGLSMIKSFNKKYWKESWLQLFESWINVS